MSTEKEETAAQVWALTLGTYSREGVAAACIGLQDRHGVGVSALLALMGLAALGYPVADARAMERVLARAEDWQWRVIEPLRRARRALRQAASDGIEEEAAGVRRALLAQEIETERLQQQLLVTDVLGGMTGLMWTSDDAGRMRPAESVARLYLARFIEHWSEDEEEALQLLLDAMAGEDAGPLLD
ncbi:TIGR02444 family protein [Spiribacter sp. 221]|uniref:TIGR02444 family protein n=1 Tax=Spiribacter onubensis TaxID=3122420 RepID=UPI00349F18A0